MDVHEEGWAGAAYAGVGSRSTPAKVLEWMESIGRAMAEAGMVLRSGGAHGADSAFERGCDSVGGDKRIYLPKAGYRGRRPDGATVLVGGGAWAQAVGRRHHPAWDGLGGYVKLRPVPDTPVRRPRTRTGDARALSGDAVEGASRRGAAHAGTRPRDGGPSPLNPQAGKTSPGAPLAGRGHGEGRGPKAAGHAGTGREGGAEMKGGEEENRARRAPAREGVVPAARPRALPLREACPC